MRVTPLTARLRVRSAAVFLLLTTVSLAGVTLALNSLFEQHITEDARHSIARINSDLLSLVTPEMLEGNYDFVRRVLVHTAIHEPIVRIAVLDESDRVVFSSRHGEEGASGEAIDGFSSLHAQAARTSPAPVIFPTDRSSVAFASYTGVYSPADVTTFHPQRRWVFFLETDWRSDLLASRHRLLVEAGAIWATLILLCAIGYMVMHRAVTRPIEDLRSVMRRFAAGDTGARATVGRLDEIGELGNQFNHLSETVVHERRSLAQRNEQLQQEVQARRLAEERAATMHRRLLDAVDALPVGFFLSDRADRVVLSNARWHEIVWNGQTVDAGPGQSVEALIERYDALYHPTYLTVDGTARSLSLKARLALRRQGGGSFAMHRNDGRIVRVEESRTAEGGIVSIFIDETARRRSETFLRMSADVAKVAGWWLEPTEMRLEMSQELRGILALTPDTAIAPGAPLPGVTAGEWEILTTIVRTTARTGQSFDHVLSWRTPSGEERCARMIGHPELSGNRCVGVFGALQDITDVKRREAADREREKMVSLGRLASGVAHEINNLLHPVLNGAKMARRLLDQQPEAAVRYLEGIQRSTVQVRELVARVLAFARRSSTDRVLLPFAHLLDDAVELIRPRVPPSVVLDVSIDRAEQELIYASPNDMSQIITNLVMNAVDALEKGGRIRISGRRLGQAPMTENLPDQPLPDGPGFLLVVADDGPGMDAQTLKGVFEPFFTTKPTGQGTGLGLPIVKGIVTDMNGCIWMESRPGEGCTVRIWLPCASPVEDKENLQSAVRTEHTTKTARPFVASDR